MSIAIGVPIAIHLIGRRRARIVQFAALDFLMATKRRTARRLRLRERLVLLVRALACLAVAIALAKPFTSCERKGPQVTRGPQAAVLVIDDSFAAGYLVDGKPWLKHASDEARRILTQLGPEAEVAIVRASEGAEHPTELTRDHLRLRDQLLALEPTRAARRHDARARPAPLSCSPRRATRARPCSCCRCSRRPGCAPTSRRGARTGRRSSSLDLRPAQHAEPRGHVAQASIRDPSTGTRGVAFDAEVGNFSDAADEGRALAHDRGSRRRARRARVSRAHEKKTKRFLAALPAGARATDASVSLAGDALAIDDRRYVRATLRDEVRVLLVDGDPRTVRHDDELFYLEAALRPGDREDSGTSVRSITAEELAGIDPRSRGQAADDRSQRLRRRRARERRRAAGRARRARSRTWVTRRRRHPRRARRSRRSGRVRPHDAAAACRRACAIRSTRRGARRPTIATAARSTS